MPLQPDVRRGEELAHMGVQKLRRRARRWLLDIPRANWQEIEEASTTVGVALANRLCRQDDTLRVKMPDDEDLPSEQLFDALLDENNNPGTLARRQSTGDMSWMMTVQPSTSSAMIWLAFSLQFLKIVYHQRFVNAWLVTIRLFATSP